MSNSPDAIHYLEKQPVVDLILSDVVIDGSLSGYDVARWVRNNLPQCKILWTSGLSEQMAEDHDVRIAMLLLLPKPYGFVELQRAFNSILENKTEVAKYTRLVFDGNRHRHVSERQIFSTVNDC